MSSSILSQGEIDALLNTSKTESFSDDLLSILNIAAQNIKSWLQAGSEEPLNIEGPYVERLSPSLTQSGTEKTVVVAADLGKNEVFMFMSYVDAGYLPQKFQVDPSQAMQMLAQAWIEEMARLLGIPSVVFQGQKVNFASLAQLPIHGKAYLVRYLLQIGSNSLEFCFLFNGTEALGLQAAKQIGQGQTGKSTRNRLLKGNKSPVTEAIFTPIDQLSRGTAVQGMNLLEDIDLLVTVELGRMKMTLNDLLELKPQSVIRLDRHAGEPVDVYVNYNKTAKGEVIVLEENFGVRILEILPKSERMPRE